MTPLIASIDDIPPENAIICAVFSADSLYVYGGCHDGRVRKWDATTGAELASFQVSQDYVVMALAVSNDDDLALCGLGDKTVRVIHLSHGAEVHVLSGHERFLRAVAVSPNEELLATGDNSGHVLVWNADSGQLRFDLPTHRSAIVPPLPRPLDTGSRLLGDFCSDRLEDRHHLQAGGSLLGRN